MASASPMAWVPRWRNESGSGSDSGSRRWMRPGLATSPDRGSSASTTTAKASPSQSSSSSTGSPSRSITRTPAGARARTRRASSSPAASSERKAFPRPITAGRPVHAEGQEVRGAGDARVVVPDGLLAPPGQLVAGEVQKPLHHLPEVLLDDRLVLRGGRDDLGVLDQAVVPHPVAVVQDPAGGLGDAVAGGAAGVHLDPERVRRLVFLDQANGLVAGVQQLDG